MYINFDFIFIFQVFLIVIEFFLYYDIKKTRGSISGTDSQSSLSPTLKQSTLKVLNTKSICIKSNTNNNNNYCALDEANSSNACYGDSGGPMMHYRNGRWYLYGLTSFVLTQASKCYPSLPSFYTIIPKYLDWIGNIITTLSSSV